jgi:hypothetical protein
MEEDTTMVSKNNPFEIFFNEKIHIGSLAEKAKKNFISNNVDGPNKLSRLYYFSIGHALKKIDYNATFKCEFSKDRDEKIPTRFLNLCSNSFDDKRVKYMDLLIGDIRNICSHYLHNFDKISISDNFTYKENGKTITLLLEEVFASFLNEAFELAVRQTCSKGKNDETDKDVVAFLCDKFFIGKNLNISKDEAIKRVLYIVVDKDSPVMDGSHVLFTAHKGTYLSFYACLFFLSMFLYKHEAVKLISRIKGFKRSDKVFSEKRDLFTFYSKKVSSRDVTNEEEPLVKFRDIIQYLSHYPTVWNDFLLLNPENTHVKDLLNGIVAMESKRLFPKMFVNPVKAGRFIIYVKYHLFVSLYSKKALEREYFDAELTGAEEEKFNKIVSNSRELLGVCKKLNDLRSSAQANREDTEKEAKIKACKEQIKELVNNGTNAELEKIAKRIDSNLFISSYGRNQDRFMTFAMRYLAETMYFGDDALFEIYRFETIKEQVDFFNEAKKELNKKQYDRIRMKHGRVTEFVTYQDLVKNHSGMPFVFENNAIQVFIPKEEQSINAIDRDKLNGLGTFYVIQRSLMVYLLEHALFHDEEISFRDLITRYDEVRHDKLDEYNKELNSDVSLSAERKKEMKKLLPKRLLNHYLPAESDNSLSAKASFYDLIDKTEEQGKRYTSLRKQAEKGHYLEYFDKKNKGKSYKLVFVWEAWNRMFFADIFREQVAESSDGKNHKHFNVTRDEYKIFMKWMYGLGDTPQYKDCLQRLFQPKKFFENNDFKLLFERGNSLDDFYQSTLQLYKQWADRQSLPNKENKYKLENYVDLLDSNIVYINLHTFMDVMRERNILNLKPNGHNKYKTYSNIKYLIDFYYISATFDSGYEGKDKKEYRKLYNKLNSVRIEDALLYEIAIKYLISANSNNNNYRIKTSVTNFYDRYILYPIKDNHTHQRLYDVSIPFNNIDAFDRLIILNNESDMVKQLKEYLSEEKYVTVFSTEEMRTIRNSFIENNVITYNNLVKVTQKLQGESLQFSNLILAIERYYFNSKNISLKDEDGGYFSFDSSILCDEDHGKSEFNEIRRAACHFDIPPQPYRTYMKKMEQKFIEKYIVPSLPMSWNSMNCSLQDVCRMFMVTLNQKRRDESDEEAFNRCMQGISGNIKVG